MSKFGLTCWTAARQTVFPAPMPTSPQTSETTTVFSCKTPKKTKAEPNWNWLHRGSCSEYDQPSLLFPDGLIWSFSLLMALSSAQLSSTGQWLSDLSAPEITRFRALKRFRFDLISCFLVCLEAEITFSPDFRKKNGVSPSSTNLISILLRCYWSD